MSNLLIYKSLAPTVKSEIYIMLLKDFIRNSVNSLSALYDKEEAQSMVMYYCTEVFGFPVYQHITEPATEVPEELLEEAMDDMRRLADSEPLQYVLGYTEFCGRRFAVDARALIPRAETEVLCQEAEKLAAQYVAVRSTGGAEAPLPAHAGLRVLDLCTGSGCIAWTLALDLPGAEVVASDLSQDALDLADSQFRTASGRPSRLPKEAMRPCFVCADLLNVDATVATVALAKAAGEGLPGFDLLTANPPYVMVAEKADMRQNVLGWEPHMAIFAPEEDPLVFHKAIAEVASRVLVPGGRGIVEINSELPDQTAAVFTSAGFEEVRIIPDYFDRPRFISFRRP